MNVILCGMMGAGKTTVGAALAKRTGRSLYDTDAVIVEKYGRISDIFSQHGEEHFRNLETQTVCALSNKDEVILSVGGGLVLHSKNVEMLKEKGKIFYLRASMESLAKRLYADKDRPLLQTGGESLEERLSRLLETRAPVYESVADFVVETDGKTPESIAEEIEQFIEKI